MADIINMVWTMPEAETRPSEPRGIARLAARRDSRPDSRRGRPGRQGQRQRAPEEPEQEMEFARLPGEVFSDYIALEDGLIRAADLDFVVAESNGEAVLEMRDQDTQAVLLQIPLENPHELAANSGVLLREHC